MKLNQRSLIYFRNFLSSELNNTITKERIQISTELLEQLLFTYNKETGAKQICWSGSFLRKIDLSKAG